MTQLDPAPEDLRATAARPFGRAQAMPKSVYASESIAAPEQGHIFGRDRLCAGPAEGLPDPGDCLTMALSDEPIIILRDRAGQSRGLPTLCRHRMSTLREGQGNRRRSAHPSHARTCNPEGSLRGAPAMARNEACRKGAGLPSIRVGTLRGRTMVALNSDAPPPADTPARGALSHLKRPNSDFTRRIAVKIPQAQD